MGLNNMIRSIKDHPEYPKMGMIASHLGVVRETSLNGRKVVGIEVTFHKDIIAKIVRDIEMLPGVVKVEIEIYSGRLGIGDEIMAVAVGGDTREHVFPALMTAVALIKEKGSIKKEFYMEAPEDV